jgi:hypothetical protein
VKQCPCVKYLNVSSFERNTRGVSTRNARHIFSRGVDFKS